MFGVDGTGDLAWLVAELTFRLDGNAYPLRSVRG